MDKNYNWWTDPKNQEEVERISWWNHKENQDVFNLPISVVNGGDHWVASFNEETKKYFGNNITGIGQGKTKEEALHRMFLNVRLAINYSEECRLNYQRFVPFRKGDWKHVGGRWFTIFGFNFYFRYGEGMKYGKYIPLTKLNISIRNEWKIYKNWLKENKFK